MSSIPDSLSTKDSLIIPAELENIIEAVVDFYEQAKDRLESSRLLEDLQINLRNWITQTQEEIKKVESSSGSLTAQQEEAYEQIIDFLDGHEQFFRLNGYAGTGKTYLMVKVIEYLKARELSYVVVAPTNKAAKNIRQMAQEQGLEIQATTVAKLLRLQPVINLSTGQQNFEYVDDKELEITDYNVIILDEYSMLSKDNFKDLQQGIYGTDTKIIFVGDKAQLPPVNEKEPIVSKHPTISESANLTQVVRYEGAIGQVAEAIRSNPRWNRQTYPFQTTPDQTIIKLNSPQWLSTALEYYQSENWLIDNNYIRVIAWRNKTVAQYNRAVREALYGTDTSQLVIGDVLIAKKPVFRKVRQGKLEKKVIILNNSEECKVIETPQLSHNNRYGWQFYEVKVRTDEGTTLELRILTEDSEQLRQQELSKLAKRAKEDVNYSERKKRWAIYYELDSLFDNLAYAYALTCHKAQGSSLDYVFLAVSDMHFCSDKQKILYTGLTRAKKRCYIT